MSDAFNRLNLDRDQIARLASGTGVSQRRPDRQTHYACPMCFRALSFAEIIEKYCAACGDIAPQEVRD